MDVSIIIPIFNEEENVNELFRQLDKVLKKIKGQKEIIVVDDGSDDRSFEQIKRIKQNTPELKGLRFRKNLGKSSALTAGFQQAEGEVVVTIDSDLQDNPKDIIRMIDKIEQGWDVVVGKRVERRDNFSKKVSTKLFNTMVTAVSGMKIDDYNCGLKAYKQEVVSNLNLSGGMHRFIPVIASWEGFSVTQLEVENRPRLHGESKYGVERAVRGILDLVTIVFLYKYAKRPMRLFGVIGIIFMIFGTVFGVNLTWLRLQGEKIGDRPLLILSALLLMLGMQFFSIGLLGEQLAAKRKEVFPIVEKI